MYVIINKKIYNKKLNVITKLINVKNLTLSCHAHTFFLT
jgi:hypothetical protein